MARKFKSSSYSKGMQQASTTYNVYYRRSLLVPNEEFIDFLLTHCKKNHIQKTKKKNKMAAHLFNESGQMQEVDIPDIFDVLEGGEDESAVKVC